MIRRSAHVKVAHTCTETYPPLHVNATKKKESQLTSNLGSKEHCQNTNSFFRVPSVACHPALLLRCLPAFSSPTYS